VKRQLALLGGQRLGVSFVLNVGGLRVLPLVAEIGLPAARAETRIFATSGTANGAMVAMSTIPGEIVRLGAGSYRVESRFTPGNVSKTANINVKPGIMSAVQLELPAGVALLESKGATDGVVWTIESASGEVLPPVNGLHAAVVLAPGKYKFRARLGAEEHVTEFTIAAGKAQEVSLGN
jgi:hypothetical protein